MTFRDGTLVDWHEWGETAFETADRTGTPVLCSLTAPWCEWCDRMDERVYSDPKLAANVGDSFVPVRVDVDRHPRIRERYNMGGFPTTVFLTPDGEVLSGATYLGPDGLRQVLDSVRATWDAKGASAGRIPRSLRGGDRPAGEVTAGIEAHMVEQVAAAFDGEFGGWGTDAKFPLSETIEFALKRDRDRGTRTLEAVRTHLFDTYDGGFYRFAETRRWGDPHREKLIDENAALLRAFTTGYLYTGEESYRGTAERTVEYLTTTGWTGEAFAASQAAGDYYALEPTEREEAEPPYVDPTVLADRNGMAAAALFGFAAVTDHEGAARYAERALEYVLETLADDGRVRHFEGADSETGLLVDHARLLAGLTAAAQVTGPDGWLGPARSIAEEAIDRLAAADGSFSDGSPEGAGLLDRPLYPIGTNAEMAHALLDLAALTGEARYGDAATDALSAFAGAYDRMGVEAAGYAAACARAHYDPLVVRTPPSGTDLHRAALRIADHEKVVVPEDREDAVAVRAGEPTAPAETPEELLERAGDGPTR
ncbi:DUF255 domain-containing protein [Natronomonas sp. F2-12]|uniref:DUF255 domain-containing protein n=1 Tax=Natronomonas aquatica TaxID=2841590 RepID=A0A9R1CUE3_9EURY|nr:DUF255 domain-containing protein [Natronomonas aquatica]MCQ4333978.1 DUF255 domain-containing protein [Natronomonas aquatica]